MLGIKLLYLLVLAALISFYILYIDTFALIVLICALALPLLLKLILLWLKFSSAAAMTCDTDTCSAGESIPITLTVRNQSPFAFSHVHALVELKHSFGTGKERMRLHFPLQARNVTKMTFYIHAEFCGSVELTVKKLYALDYFHLFRTNLKLRQKSTNILILPQRVPLPLANLAEPVLFPDSDAFGDKPGDDPSEIFGMHEYAPGDPVSRIHWKLSSKSDKLFVKEFSTPIQKSVLLILEWSGTSSNVRAGIQEAETMLTLFYSLTCQMLEMQIVPTIMWYDQKEQEMECQHLSSDGQLSDLFRALYSTIHSMEMEPQALKDAAAGQQYSSATCITNRLPQTLLDIFEHHTTANQKTVVLVHDEDANIPDFWKEETQIVQVHTGTSLEEIRELVI